MLAVIGGTGFYSWSLLKEAQEQTIDTPYGQATFWLGEYKNKKLIFVPRHGISHRLAPHLINYRANIYALKKTGVSKILAVNSVGALTKDLAPADLLLVDDFIDLTYNRGGTFYDEEEGVHHTDMTEAYDTALRQEVAACACVAGVDVKVGGVYACMQGPRFETPAEVRMLALLGGTVVGMTGLPEASLAKEAGIAYVSLCIVVNMAAGLAARVDFQEINDLLHNTQHRLQQILTVVAERIY